jgi:hypothetical protein
MSGFRLALAFLVSPLAFVASYWLFLIVFWGGAGGYLYEGLGALVVGYPIGLVLVAVGGVPLVRWRLPAWLGVAVFVAAGLAAAGLWVIVTRGRLGGIDFQFFELCAVSSGLTYPAFVRLAALPRPS